MKLFNRDPTEEEIRKKALDLIFEQFEDRHYMSIPGYIGKASYSPASKYARELLEEAMQETKVVDAINSTISSEVVDDVVHRILKDMISTEIRDILKEDLITDIVAKINKVQLGEKK